ncbi:unnamed protein product [Acanthoscelides obtectus]|uniref:Uncharacterized protein n=1 Tax=Acanthoscelides obtectus TaxID=200917 RepID=A0A9P0M6P2_ACAOB|nr:unnamed protein product [Acanthoscelides obtectus]CAK1669419.1 hypothetical protein AOBTE_LOCUS26998 [Acanthoscelides obtectus]
MSSRSRKIVELALKDGQTSGDESDPFCSIDSDLDPTFLPSSDEEILSSSDVSESESSVQKKTNSKCKLQPSKTVSKKLNPGKIKFLDQPCCSKSLSTDVSYKEIEAANATTIPCEQNEQFEEFFEVETLAQAQPQSTEGMQESDNKVDQNLLDHMWTQPVGNHQEFE